MNRIIFISNLFVVILLLSSTNTAAQKAKSSSTPYIDTTTHKTKLTKTQADADAYINTATAAKAKFKSLFPTKAGDTIYVVIPGITYADPNLKLLKQQLDDVKNTKGLTTSYRGGTAVVKIIYKGGTASGLYDMLGDSIKEIFLADDVDGNRIILNYKLAKTEADAN